jgi:hypothetical protein
MAISRVFKGCQSSLDALLVAYSFQPLQLRRCKPVMISVGWWFWWFDRRSVEKVWPKEGPSTELAACLGSQRLRVQPSEPWLGLVESASTMRTAYKIKR